MKLYPGVWKYGYGEGDLLKVTNSKIPGYFHYEWITGPGKGGVGDWDGEAHEDSFTLDKSHLIRKYIQNIAK